MLNCIGTTVADVRASAFRLGVEGPKIPISCWFKFRSLAVRVHKGPAKPAGRIHPNQKLHTLSGPRDLGSGKATTQATRAGPF